MAPSGTATCSTGGVSGRCVATGTAGYLEVSVLGKAKAVWRGRRHQWNCGQVWGSQVATGASQGRAALSQGVKVARTSLAEASA